MSLKKIFTDIYQTNAWNGVESASGIGSDTNQTQFLVTELGLFLKKIKVRSMLDIPCGDFNWMQKVEFDGFYIGADIVEPLIERNRELYNDPLREFTVLNVIEDKLP